MLKVVPDLMRLDAVRTLFSFTSKYFKSPKLRQVFSFETLLVGGNPLSVPAIYAMIHFVEKTWGIHYAMGGTGALVRAFVQKFEELGGRIEYGQGVEEILVADDRGRPVRLPVGKRVARGVRLEGGQERHADIVVSNGDWANTYLKRVPAAARLVNTDLRVKAARQSMSLLVIYLLTSWLPTLLNTAGQTPKSASLIALMFSYLGFQLLKPAFQQLHIAREFASDLTENYSLYFSFVVFAVGVGLIAGLLPASYLSAFKPVSVLKDSPSGKSISRQSLRKTLIVAQFTLSIGFIIVIGATLGGRNPRQ